MEETRINEIIQELEQSVPKADAKVRVIMKYDDDPLEILASRNGYLRLGIECIKASIAPSKNPNSYAINADWDYLFAKDSIKFSRVARTENVDLPQVEESTSERAKEIVSSIFVFALLLFLIASTVVGC